MALMISASAASIGGATVNATALNVRAEATTQSAIVTAAPSGAAVVVYGAADDGWYKVGWQGIVGYMSSHYLNFSETLEGDLGTGNIIGSSVRLRSAPGYEADVLGYYGDGTAVEITAVSGEWMRVSTGDAEGYMHSDYIGISADETAGTAYSGIGQTIVDTGYKYTGVPYVWAGTSPYGFDCSGFVYYVFTENGYTVNRTAASLYNNGTAVDRSELIPGDIICFTDGSYYNIGHVGIYVGDGNFIHASSGAGYVTTNSLSENYYNSHYYGARRIAA